MNNSNFQLSLHFQELSLDHFHTVIILDQLLSLSPFSSSTDSYPPLYYHAEATSPPLFTLSTPACSHNNSLALQHLIHKSSVNGLPPGPAQTFYVSGIQRTYVISGYDSHFPPEYSNAFRLVQTEEKERQLREQALKLSLLLATFIEEMICETSSDKTSEENPIEIGSTSVFPDIPIIILHTQTKPFASQSNAHILETSTSLPFEQGHLSNDQIFSTGEEFNYNITLDTGRFNVNATYLNELLTCLAVNGTCTMMEELLGLENGFVTKKTRTYGMMNNK